MAQAWLAQLLARIGMPAALFLAGAALIWLTTDKIDDMTAAARAQAVAERDAHWAAVIEKANAAAERRAADQARAAIDAEASAAARIAAAEKQLADMESVNASLPDTSACGLGRDRIRLLNK